MTVRSWLALPAADRDRLATLLRTCIECGLCLPHCATYLATGSETQSPRGRLQLIGEALDAAGGDAAVAASDSGAREALDLCLGCRACETACPSGVAFDLLETVKAAAAGPPRGPATVLRPHRLAALRPWGDAAERLGVAAFGPRWRDRLSHGPRWWRRAVRLLGSRPAAPGDDDAIIALLDGLTGLRSSAVAETHVDEPRDTITLFAGCANAGLLPGTQRRLVALLSRSGFAVEMPQGQGCCGAFDAHGGRPREADRLLAANVAALAASVGRTGRLLVEAAGCGLELDAYPESIAAAVVDAAVLLADADLPPLRPLSLRVAYHDPCHARHGRGIVDEPRRLLRRIPGLAVVEPGEAEVCCGSGGPYALRHPELSDVMGRRKARFLAGTGADLVVTSNPGCLGQIRDALAREAPELPILPLSDLIWYASQADD